LIYGKGKAKNRRIIADAVMERDYSQPRTMTQDFIQLERIQERPHSKKKGLREHTGSEKNM
jgi:hypothetical protein